MRPNLLVIVASTRPGRVGLPVGQWFRQRAAEHASFEVTYVDLAELGLPLLDEPNHPKMRKYVHQHTKDWSAVVDGADAIALVTPEYNHGYSAPLKNSLDYLHEEWADKPVGFVSYGGVAAGTRAMQQLKPVLVALRMTPVVEAVNIPFVAEYIKDGVFAAPELIDTAADAMLGELARVEALCRPARREVEAPALAIR